MWKPKLVMINDITLLEILWEKRLLSIVLLVSKLYCLKVKSSQRKIEQCPLYSHFQLITNNINGYPFVLWNFHGEFSHTFSFHYTSLSIFFNRPASDPTKDSKDTKKKMFCFRLSSNYKPKDTNKWSDRSFVFHPFHITNHLFFNCTKRKENSFAFSFQIKSGFLVSRT